MKSYNLRLVRYKVFSFRDRVCLVSGFLPVQLLLLGAPSISALASIGPESGILLSPILAWLRFFLQINTGNLRGSHMVQPEWKVGAYWYRLP